MQITEFSVSYSSYSGTWTDDYETYCGLVTYETYSITYDSDVILYSDYDSLTDSRYTDIFDNVVLSTDTSGDTWITITPYVMTEDADITFTILGYYDDYISDSDYSSYWVYQDYSISLSDYCLSIPNQDVSTDYEILSDFLVGTSEWTAVSFSYYPYT